MTETLLVDVANVVGSRPDGWWRDRPGATRRLRDAIAAADVPADVVLVVEGAARQGLPSGTEAGLRVVHARGAGDDAIVELLGSLPAETTVVTSDRGLRTRVEARGVAVVGAGWLLDRIASTEPGDRVPGGIDAANRDSTGWSR